MVVCSVFFAEREANATRVWLKRESFCWNRFETHEHLLELVNDNEEVSKPSPNIDAVFVHNKELALMSKNM